jgi:LysM repeat protein
MPHDTLQGLALRYRIPVSELRRFNTLPSNNVQILKTLRVPISHNQPIEPQEMTDNEVTLQRFRNETGESLEEAKFYLEESKWVLQEALQLWKEDDRYEKAKFEVDKYQKSSEIRSEIFDKFEIVQPLMVIFVD